MLARSEAERTHAREVLAFQIHEPREVAGLLPLVRSVEIFYYNESRTNAAMWRQIGQVGTTAVLGTCKANYPG